MNCHRAAAGSLILSAALLLARPAAATIIVDCTVVNGVNNVSGYLQTQLNNNGGQTYDIKGTCLGPVSVPPFATLNADVAGGTIKGHVTFSGAGEKLDGLVIDGSGLNQFEGVIVYTSSAFATIDNCTIQNWVGPGSQDAAVLVFRGGSATIAGGAIENNSGFGLAVVDGGTVELGYDNDSGLSAAVVIQNNGSGGSAGGIDVNIASLDIQNATVQNNQGNGITATLGEIIFSGGTIAAASGSGVPAIQLYRSGLVVSGTVTGPGNAPTILASSNSTVLLQGGIVSDTDASGNDGVLYIEDGSAAHSNGGNVITNSAAGGVAVKVTNGSTFHQRIEPGSGSPAGADTITGAGSVHIESNIELGTGASTPSTWTGNIIAAQNSSIRMDGGITVTGTAKLTQASNGFFNVSNGGLNVVTLGVTCPFTTNAASHVAGNSLVLLTSSGPSAVMIGNVSPDCLGF